MCTKNSKNISEDDMRRVECVENFLRPELEKMGFRLSKRHYHKNIFWFWISRKGFLHFSIAALNIIVPENKMKLDVFELVLPEEDMIDNLLKECSKLCDIQILEPWLVI